MTVRGAVAPRPGDPAAIRDALRQMRQRTLLIASGFSDADLAAPALPILSPPVWDLGHIANFQEQWLVQKLARRPELRAGANDTYDAFAHPRTERPALRLLDRAGAMAYLDETLAASLAVLDAVDEGALRARPAPAAAMPPDREEGRRARNGGQGRPPSGKGSSAALDPRLLAAGFVHWMIVLHEAQHQETLLQSAQVRGPGRYGPHGVRALPVPAVPVGPGWLPVAGGPFAMGVAPGPAIYDNESPLHTVHVRAFEIARLPVTNADYAAFMADGGYETARWWSAAGRKWLDATSHHAPLHWRRATKDSGRAGGARASGSDRAPAAGWVRDALTGTAPVSSVGDEILVHVSFHEAEAYARHAGARLPTEAEWEKACRHDASGRVRGRNPWGDTAAGPDRANVDQLAFGPSRVGSYPTGASPCGALHMIGDAWEWTASDFEPYPGFEAYPYDEYSKVFFGPAHKVLRGGSWATQPGCATGTFRNWDLPVRKQIFAGIRLARDA